MTLLLSLALQAAAAPTLGAIGRQDLPAHGCAAFLWVAGDGTRSQGVVAMAGADPAQLRLSLDGKVVDLPRIAQHGAGVLGLSEAIDYRAGDIGASLALTVVTRAELSDGAAVPQATLSLTRDGGDALVVPLAGLIGCRPAG